MAHASSGCSFGTPSSSQGPTAGCPPSARCSRCGWPSARSFFSRMRRRTPTADNEDPLPIRGCLETRLAETIPTPPSKFDPTPSAFAVGMPRKRCQRYIRAPAVLISMAMSLTDAFYNFYTIFVAHATTTAVGPGLAWLQHGLCISGAGVWPGCCGTIMAVFMAYTVMAYVHRWGWVWPGCMPRWSCAAPSVWRAAGQAEGRVSINEPLSLDPGR